MKRLTACLMMGVALGCASSGDVDIRTLASSSDDIIWEAGEKAFEKKQWENARQHYRRIIDAFPNSPHGPEARLKLGDAYFREGGTANHILAVSAYRDFLTLYPSNARSDYAQFQVAEGYFKQRNPPDRDQTATARALTEFQRLLEQSPDSSVAEMARERIILCRQNLARSEHQVGYFYQRTRSSCRAAARRYEAIVSEYPDYKNLDEVLYRLGQCLSETGRGPEALPYLDRLIVEFPQSQWVDDARQLMQELAPATPPETPPSPALAAPKGEKPPSEQSRPVSAPPASSSKTLDSDQKPLD